MASRLNCWGDVWHALVHIVAKQPGGMKDHEECVRECRALLDEVAGTQRGLADPETGVKPGFARRLRHVKIAETCGQLVRPDGNMKRELLIGARYALGNARQNVGQATAFSIAEMKLCLFLGSHSLEDIGIDDAELSSLEAECGSYASAAVV